MNTYSRFSSKAERYARYRPDYAPEAIRLILDVVHLSPSSTVADIGSGTGILTRHFLEHAESVYAVEPNQEMRQYAEHALGSQPAFHSLVAKAEAIPLPDHSLDLISVGQALHWFEPQAVRQEFLRLLKPGGWLAILFISYDETELTKALQRLQTPEYGWQSRKSGRPEEMSKDFYYGNAQYIGCRFANPRSETWESFFGEIISSSYAPDPDHPQFARYEKAAREIFTDFQTGGMITIPFATEIYLGQVTK
jgi:ubiquinone/menaquinone biosynthesis C-methylase UbiE